MSLDIIMQTMQQQRAKFALERVKEVTADKHKEYKSYASALPFMIHANGLGQAAAFYRSKGTSDTHYLLYKLLSEWLTKKNQPFDKHKDLLDGITQESMPVYLAAQAEAMVLMDWVKKFANAFMQNSDKGKP